MRCRIEKLGMTDLVIALDAASRTVPPFTLDRHFGLIAKFLPQLKLWPE